MDAKGDPSIKKLNINLLQPKIRLKVLGNYLIVSNQMKEEVNRFPLALIRSLSINDTTKLDGQVIKQCALYDIRLELEDRLGTPMGRWEYQTPGPGSQVVFRQMKLLLSHAAEVQAASWLVDKYHNQAAWMIKQPDLSQKQLAYIKQLESYAYPEDEEAARKILRNEGVRSKKYYRMIQPFLPAHLQFEKRSRMPAEDCTNAIWNYATALLYSVVEDAILNADLDLYLGINHSNLTGKKAFLFDFIESYRPWIDDMVIALLQGNAGRLPTVDDKKTEQGYWLAQGTRRLIIESFDPFFHQVIRYKKRRLNREQHIYEQAMRFRKYLRKNY